MTSRNQVSVDSRSGHTGLRGQISRRPLIWFFAMANLLSWSAWTPYILSENGLGIWHFSFPSLLGSSQLAGMLPGAYLGPIMSAFLVTAAADGRAGLRIWARRLVKFGVSWRWYVAVLLSVPAVLFVATLPFTGGHFQLPPVVALVAYLPALVLQMVTTGLAEEPGWRDFALPRMQRRYGPVVGTLILGVLWGIWHLPLFLTEWGGWPNVDLLTPIEFVASAIALSFVMTWVFNRTGESLPLAMLAHTSVNNFFSVVWSQMFPQLGSKDGAHVTLLASVVVAIVLLVATRGRLAYKPPVPDHVVA